MKKVRTICPLDCFDVCSMITTVDNGKVIKVEGNKEHPITKGYICSKGRAHLTRLYDPDRLLSPLRKKNGVWEPVSFKDALNLIEEKLRTNIEQHGTRSILNYYDCGYSGMSRSVEDMFFNHLGGVTTFTGTLCWGAGSKAQDYDFGNRKGHAPEDMLNAQTIVLWGRNPAANNIHLLEHLKRARQNGAYVYLIDPIKTKTAQFVDEHIQVKCGGDGAMAMAISQILMTQDKINHDFIENHVIGYETYKAYVMSQSLEELSHLSGVNVNVINKLAERYINKGPSSIWIGYGMQRYKNGGNNVRAIDALAIIAGYVGIEGGGATYTHKSITQHISGPIEASEALATHKRTFVKPKLAEFILNEKETPIKMMFISRANPMTQLPDINQVKKALDQVEFKVVFDMFMTDTAKEADLIMPVTSIFEEDDFISSSMYNPYLQYSRKAIDPPVGMMGEYEVYRNLAKRMNLKDYPDVGVDEFFEMQLKSLCKTLTVSYEELKEKWIALPDIDVPYKNKKFDTPSGKIELYSNRAEEDGVSPHALLISSNKQATEYGLRLLTMRSPKSINSQHFRLEKGLPTAYINAKTANDSSIVEKEIVKIQSKYGAIEAIVNVNNHIPYGAVKMNQGWWHHSGCVNLLTGSYVSDMGNQAAYYETFVNITKLNENQQI